MPSVRSAPERFVARHQTAARAPRSNNWLIGGLLVATAAASTAALIRMLDRDDRPMPVAAVQPQPQPEPKPAPVVEPPKPAALPAVANGPRRRRRTSGRSAGDGRPQGGAEVDRAQAATATEGRAEAAAEEDGVGTGVRGRRDQSDAGRWRGCPARTAGTQWLGDDHDDHDHVRRSRRRSRSTDRRARSFRHQSRWGRARSTRCRHSARHRRRVTHDVRNQSPHWGAPLTACEAVIAQRCQLGEKDARPERSRSRSRSTKARARVVCASPATRSASPAACSSAVGGVRTRVAPDVGTVAVTATIRFKPTSLRSTVNRRRLTLVVLAALCRTAAAQTATRATRARRRRRPAPVEAPAPTRPTRCTGRRGRPACRSCTRRRCRTRHRHRSPSPSPSHKAQIHRNFAGSIQLDYMAIPTEKTGREIALDGATAEVSLKLAMDFTEQDLREREDVRRVSRRRGRHGVLRSARRRRAEHSRRSLHAGVRRVPGAPRSREPPHERQAAALRHGPHAADHASGTRACCPRRGSTTASRSTARTSSASTCQLDYAAYAIGGSARRRRSDRLRLQACRAPARATTSTTTRGPCLGGQVVASMLTDEHDVRRSARR